MIPPSRPNRLLRTGLALGAVWAFSLAAPTLRAAPPAARLARIESRVRLLRRSLARERKTRAHMRALLVRTRREIRGVEAALARLETREAALGRHAQALEGRRKADRAALVARRGDFALLARQRYVLGPEARLHLLLGDLRHPGRGTRLLADFGILAARERRRLDILRSAVARLVLVLTRLDAREADLRTLRARRTTELLHLAAVRAQRRAMLAALGGKITRHGATLNLLLARAHALAGLLGRLDRTLDRIPWASGVPLAFPRLRGALPWPTRGRLARAFGIQGIPAVKAFRDGKIAASGALIGAVMKQMRGQADAARVRELVLERLT